jgi:hypothetical protein
VGTAATTGRLARSSDPRPGRRDAPGWPTSARPADPDRGEPFALRALVVVRSDEGLLADALARFESLGLAWEAERTRLLQ